MLQASTARDLLPLVSEVVVYVHMVILIRSGGLMSLFFNAALRGGGWMRAADSLESWRRPPSRGQSQPYASGNVQQSCPVSHHSPSLIEWVASGNIQIPTYSKSNNRSSGLHSSPFFVALPFPPPSRSPAFCLEKDPTLLPFRDERRKQKCMHHVAMSGTAVLSIFRGRGK